MKILCDCFFRFLSQRRLLHYFGFCQVLEMVCNLQGPLGVLIPCSPCMCDCFRRTVDSWAKQGKQTELLCAQETGAVVPLVVISSWRVSPLVCWPGSVVLWHLMGHNVLRYCADLLEHKKVQMNADLFWHGHTLCTFWGKFWLIRDESCCFLTWVVV